MATRGRKPGSPKVPGSGRVKGKSLDKGERQLVTSRLAGDLTAVYEALGGVEWLLKFAQANPKEFIQQGLSRLFPAPQRDDADFVQHNQFNFDSRDTLEAARRVAFALNAGIYAQGRKPELIEVERVVSEPVFNPKPTDAPDMVDPGPEPLDQARDLERDMARARWVEELPLTDEQRRDAAVVRQTLTCDITNYPGSVGEQFDAPRRPSSSQPSAGERRRAVMSRRNELL